MNRNVSGQRCYCVCPSLRSLFPRCPIGAMLAAVFILLAPTWPAPIQSAPEAAVPIIVNTTGDESAAGDGFCSLREAISNANSAGIDTTGGDCVASTGTDTINFSVSGTITLASALPAIRNTLTIDGSGQSITIDGADSFQVLVVNLPATVSLNGLTIARGTGGVIVIGALTVTSSTFTGNHAGTDGGGIFNEGTLSVTNSTFSGNNAFSGGGIFNQGTLTVIDSTFTNNHALSGAGGVTNSGTATVTNSAFAGNSVAVLGTASASISARLRSPIVTPDAPASGNCFGTITNGGHNISDDGTCGFGTSTGANGQTIGDNVNPLLDPSGLKSNGGPTETIALQSNSPAIDAIPIAQCPSTDQRGLARPDPEDSGVATPACDIGAFESGAGPTPTPTATPTETPTPAPTQTPTAMPTLPSTATPTQTPTLTPGPTLSPTQTPAPTPSQTPMPTPSQTPAPTETPTRTPTETATPSPTPTATPTATPAATQSPTATASTTSTPTQTPTATPTQAIPLTKADCKHGGWQRFGFRNQGQCIKFVNQENHGGHGGNGTGHGQ